MNTSNWAIGLQPQSEIQANQVCHVGTLLTSKEADLELPRPRACPFSYEPRGEGQI